MAVMETTKYTVEMEMTRLKMDLKLTALVTRYMVVLAMTKLTLETLLLVIGIIFMVRTVLIISRWNLVLM
jgi:hypothetical protein